MEKPVDRVVAAVQVQLSQPVGRVPGGFVDHHVPAGDGRRSSRWKKNRWRW
jgi:hypothetical protein